MLLLIFFSHGAVGIQNLATSKIFKVNRQILKPFYEEIQVENVGTLKLEEPTYSD